MPLLNSYITECQTILQNTTPDNDILLFFPIDDLWTTYPGNLLLLLDVHKYADWFGKSEFGKSAKLLWDNGYAFDYLSDKQIGDLDINANGKLSVNDNSSYSVILIPSAKFINVNTLARLDSLGQKGAKIIFADKIPGHNILKELKLQGIRHEELKLKGLDYIRKQSGENSLYFVTNLGNQFYEDSISLTTKSIYFEIFDPESLKKGFIKTSGPIFLQLPPGKSCFIQSISELPESGPWRYSTNRDTFILNNSWSVSFISGNNRELKSEYSIDTLKSWTEWGDTGLKSFCGKAKYVSEFSIPNFDSSKNYRLTFDDIRETARITINGVYCGTIWCIPYCLNIPANVLKKDNSIEIVVQNLSANRIKDIDQRQIPWKKFYDTNFVDIRYQPFDASKWELVPSGLIGKVMLIGLD